VTDFVRQHHDPTSTREKVRLGSLVAEMKPFKDGAGFEQIARALGIPRPTKPPKLKPADAEGG
jgi:hypothetical protein